jgi:hypothetical protein
VDESDLVKELRALAGVKGSPDDFVLVLEGVRIRVSYSGGSSSSLALTVDYDAHAGDADRDGASGYRERAALSAVRPMRVTLRPESSDDRDGKASGLNVEFQTGDDVFDKKVYIDAPSAEPLPRVLSADVRAAALALFDLQFTSIAIDDIQGHVSARITSFSSLNPKRADGKPGLAAATAFAKLARSLPRVARREGAHPETPLQGTTILGYAIGGAGLLLGPPFYFLVLAPHGCSNDDLPSAQALQCTLPGIAGVVVGLVAGAVATTLVTSHAHARFAGRSDGARLAGGYRISIGASVFTIVALVAAGVFARLASP